MLNTGTGDLMKKTNRFASVVAFAFAVGALACAGSDPVAPAITRQARPTQAAAVRARAKRSKVKGVRWLAPLKHDVTATALIGSEGGVLTLPASGLRLVVPAGAVSEPTEFRATAIAGKVVAYDFEPAGSTFSVPLRLEQDPALVNLKHVDRAKVKVGYIPSRGDVDQANAVADVAELIPVTWSSASITGLVWHFSGYIIGWGDTVDDPGER
jgi:hypothetical protein